MAPFKFKFNRNSKSNSSTRSNSVENTDPGGEMTAGDLCSPQSNVPAILEDTENQEDNLLSTPSSPPPSYERVLQEDCCYQNDATSSSYEQQIITLPAYPKSSKEIYKALAKQFGITCKMSESCRCVDCQGNYFYCEYEQTENEKNDGGLGAGTPMFTSEVMHGSACSIL